MNENRTYGIELEFACSLSHNEATNKINQAFAAAGLNHQAICSGFYHHNNDSSNFLNWDVKTDISIRNPDIDADHPFGIEIASPVLKGTDGLKSLKVVTDILTTIAKVGKTTGLHVHHGVRASELAKIAHAWLRVQDSVYMMVPPSRQDNYYCKKWENTTLVPDTGIRDWCRRNISGRYFGLNLESFWIRGTVEFRLAAGSVDYEKISNWVIFTQLLIDKAALVNTAINDGNDLSTLPLLANWMKSLVAPLVHSTTLPVESIWPGPTTVKIPKSGTKSRLIWDAFIAGMTRAEALGAMNEQFGKALVNSHYWLCRNLHKTFLASQNAVMPNNIISAPVANDLTNAIEWAVARYKKFNRAEASINIPSEGAPNPDIDPSWNYDIPIPA